MHSASDRSVELSKIGGQTLVPRAVLPVDTGILFRRDPLPNRTSTPRLDKRDNLSDIMSYSSSDEENDGMPDTVDLEQVMKDRKTASLAADSAKRKQESESSAAPPAKSKLPMSKKGGFAVHFAAALADEEEEDPTMPPAELLPTKTARKKSMARTDAAAATSAATAAAAYEATATAPTTATATATATAPAKAKNGSSFVEQTDARNAKQYV
jgi:hypothetical protein